ncbi:MAG: hypothetical protein ACPGQD_05830, partial [Planctomycetota bacterium]
MPEDLVLWLPAAQDPERLDREQWIALAAAEMERPPEGIQEVVPQRLSFDARRRSMQWRAAVTVYLADEELPELAPPTPPRIEPPAADAPHAVVVGSGPA